MGGIPKKFTVLWALLLGLAVLFSLLSVTASISLFRGVENEKTLPSPSNDDETNYYTKWVDLASGYFTNRDETSKTVYIQSEGELAELNRIITEDLYDYSGWTFILGRNLDMGERNSNSDKKIKPVWTPISMSSGKNNGIIIDGNNKTISNLFIALNDDATVNGGVTAENGVGFFGNLVGCTVRNLTLADTIINYSYQGESKTVDDPTRPSSPVKVAVGVVAGIAENSYVSKVALTNPQVNVTANNANGHSFYVGTAVGKLIYNDQTLTPLLQSLTNPDEEPEHRWGVDSIDIVGGKVGLTVTAGEDTTAGTYGVATNGYIGGLVGYNNSSKIINSKVKGLTVVPQMAGVAGTYHAGGLVGYTMLRVPTLDDVVLTGLINNVIIDTIITPGQATNTGMLAGYVYGSWVYNNLYLGSNTELFGKFLNRYYMMYNSDKCLGNLDFEALLNNREYFHVITDETLNAECEATIVNGGYVLCPKHAPGIGEELFPYDEDGKNDSLYLQYANRYNYQKTKDEFATFQTSDTFNKLDDFESKDGNFFEIGKQKVTHEYQDEINATNIRRAVNELRVWRVVDGEPQFGDNLGCDYDVVFHANGENMVSPAGEAGSANAYWVVKGEYIDTYHTELVKKCKYKEPIKNLVDLVNEQYLLPEMPICEGWSFAGWYRDEKCDTPFDFEETVMGTDCINLYAKWEFNEYTITYYLLPDYRYTYPATGEIEAFDGTEKVVYGSYAVGPRIDPDLSKIDDKQFWGKSFAGYWYTERTGSVEVWSFGMENYTPMPAENIALYAAFRDDFVELRSKLESAEVTKAFNNRDCYTAASFGRFETAYNNGYKAMEAYNQGAMDDEIFREHTTQWILEEINNSLSNLTLSIDNFWALPPLANEHSDQNSYPFMYTGNSYRQYQEIKRTALNYLNVELNNEGMLKNLDRYVYLRDALMTAYNNLVPNPNLGVDSNLLNEVKRSYAEIMATIDTFDPADYTAESWQDSNFDLVRGRFKEAFKSDYQNPYIADLKAAVDNYNAAKAQLVRTQGTPSDPEQNNDKEQGGGLQVVIGVLIALAAVIGVGSYVGVDLYLTKKVRPKKEQAEKAEQSKAEDTFI